MKKALPKTALSLKGVTVYYAHHLALDNLSISVPEKSLTAVLGPNGGGKSTFLKAILGLVPLQKGSIQKGFDPKDIAYLPQQNEIDRSFPLTVHDVVALGLCQSKGFYKKIGKEADIFVQKALEQVGLADAGGRSLNTLSGGQFQRVLFARLILQNAKLILLDEPFAAVDSYTLEDLIEIVKMWVEEERTVIVVTHDLDLVRMHFSQSLLLARRIIAYGSTEKVMTLENLRAAKRNACNWENNVSLEKEQPMQIFKP